MKWYKRVWLSIIRRPAKTILLFVTVFILSNLLAGSLSIIQTSKLVKGELENSITPKINVYFEKYYIENKVHYTRSLNENQMNEFFDIMNTLRNDEAVKANIELYSLPVAAKYVDLGWPSINKNEFNINLLSTNVIENHYFIEGEHNLLRVQNNRFFTDEELESDEVLIVVDKDLQSVTECVGSMCAVSNTGLSEIGNEVQFIIHSPTGNHDFKFKAKIIGVLYNKTKQPFQNMAYISNNALLKLVKEANDYFEQVGDEKITVELQSATLSMKTLDDVKDFNLKYSNLFKEFPDGVEVESSEDIYKKNIGPVDNLDIIAKYIFISSILATFIILGFIIVFSINDRKNEIGIYASVGERKRNTISQMLCEILLISTLGIGCASMTGIYLGNKLSDYMLDVQRYVLREKQLGVIANLPTLYKPVKDGLTMKTREDIIKNYDVKPTSDYFVTIFVVGECSVLVSCLLPMAYLVSLKPKKIML